MSNDAVSKEAAGVEWEKPADGLSGFREQLRRGTVVEQEHTRGRVKSKAGARAIAREIARDHLREIPDYCTRLDKMEREAKKRKRRR